MTDLEKLLQSVREARAAYEERLDAVQSARDDYYRLVGRLSEAGMPLREIAAELGLSHQRVHQMVSDAPEKAKRRAKVLRRATSGLLLAGLIAYLAVASPFDSTEPRGGQSVTSPDAVASLESHKPDRAVPNAEASVKRGSDRFFQDGSCYVRFKGLGKHSLKSSAVFVVERVFQCIDKRPGTLERRMVELRGTLDEQQESFD